MKDWRFIMRERVYKTTRRTREQIEKEDKQFSNCFRCGVELEPIKVPRVQPRMCNKCRRNANVGEAELKKIPQMLQKLNAKNNNVEEEMFEDCPIAVAEYEQEKNVRHKWFTPVNSPTGSMLSTMMSSNPNNYKHKVGSARDGIRYKRKDL
jgi:Zn-finger nucleic acid-binding protein